MNGNGRDLPIYHDPSVPVSLGCEPCPELGLCGGLHTAKGLHNCHTFCECSNPSKCPFVCPRKLEDFVSRVQEIRGFTLDNIPRAPDLQFPSIPGVIHHLYGASHRNGRLRVPAVSVPLVKLFYRKTGLPKFRTKAEVAKAFGFDPKASLVINGVSEDQPIEDYWTHRRATKLPNSFALLEPVLISVPNYSVFANVPRWDDLYSIKRIAISWYEFMLAGIPASLHLNGRTDSDWNRWTEFINNHPEVRSITFEFATGAAHKERAEYYVQKLIELANNVDRSLQLLTRGGVQYLNRLDAAFAECILIDTNSYVKTTKRRKLEWHAGQKKHWRSAKTPKGAPLDDLLLHNTQTTEAMIAYARRLPAETGTAKPLSLAEGKFISPNQIRLPWPQFEMRSQTRLVPQPPIKLGRALARSATK